MDLFERYLQAVKKHLPWQRQDDIVAELRANLEAQLEEREAELGRPLTEGEMVDWLKHLGPPMAMAARYQPPRYLIGPTLFPTYWVVLRLAVLWASVVYAITTVARMVAESRGPAWLAHAVAGYPSVLLLTAAWVTAARVALEYFSTRFPDKVPAHLTTSPVWSPTSLPPLEKVYPGGGKPKTLATTVAEFVVEFVLLVWLLLIPNYPFLLLGPAAGYLEHSAIRLAHISVVFFWAVVGFNLLQFGWHGYALLSGNWRVRSTALKLTTKALGMVPVLVLLAAPGHVYLEANPAEAARMPAGLDLASLNQNLYWGVVVLVCITVVQFGWEVWKVREKARRQHLAAVL